MADDTTSARAVFVIRFSGRFSSAPPFGPKGEVAIRRQPAAEGTRGSVSVADRLATHVGHSSRKTQGESRITAWVADWMATMTKPMRAVMRCAVAFGVAGVLAATAACLRRSP